METNKRSLFSPQFVLGILIIAVGVLFMLNNLGYYDAIDLIRYWPALLVVYGIAKLAESPGSSGKVFGGVLAAVGILMLLDRMYYITFRLSDWWPLILIIVGFNFLRGSVGRSGNIFERQHRSRTNDEGADKEAFISSFGFMSGIRRSITSKEFRGGEITGIMAGCELDLREAAIKDDEAVIDVFLMMGGIEMRVPADWAVVVQAVPIMGGVEDKTYIQPEGKPSKRLVLTGNIIMGGIEIKN
jgi:predicted membrane protein